jgi:PAS domain S-box-containing protein
MDVAKIVADALLAAAADAVVATDREGTIRLWSPGAERIFGFGASEALGQSLDLIIPERLRPAHWHGFRKVMETGQSRYGEGDLLAVPGLRKNGERLSLEFTIIPLKDAQGRMAGLAAVMRDVTSRFNEMKALRQRLAETSGRGRDS